MMVSRQRFLLLAALGAAACLNAGGVRAGSASSDTRSLPLPVDFAPEGIAIGADMTFYVGSLADGDIYAGDLRTGDGAVLVDAPAGRVAVGLKIDRQNARLFVAGGPAGTAYIYDVDSGESLAEMTLATGADTLINDVVVTVDAAYFTDSMRPAIYKVPIGPGGELGEPETITVSGPAGELPAFPNLNGIEATPDGSTLIVGHSSLGALFTVDPATGVSQQIALTGDALTAGNADGLILQGPDLYVVENFSNRVLQIRLDPDLASGEVTSVVTNDDVGGLFRVPTTGAASGNLIAVVNARFDLGLPPPFGEGAPPGTDYDVVVFSRPHG